MTIAITRELLKFFKWPYFTNYSSSTIQTTIKLILKLCCTTVGLLEAKRKLNHFTVFLINDFHGSVGIIINPSSTLQRKLLIWNNSKCVELEGKCLDQIRSHIMKIMQKSLIIFIGFYVWLKECS